MRVFSGMGCIALLVSAAFGFLLSEFRHGANRVPVCEAGVCEALGAGETQEAPPSRLPSLGVVEEIDLNCLPQMPYTLGPQSTEPPLAEQPSGSPIRKAQFETREGDGGGPELPPILIPHIQDTPAQTPREPRKIAGVVREVATPSVDDLAASDNPLASAIGRYFQNAVEEPLKTRDASAPADLEPRKDAEVSTSAFRVGKAIRATRPASGVQGTQKLNGPWPGFVGPPSPSDLEGVSGNRLPR